MHTFSVGPVRAYALILPENPASWVASLEPFASEDRRQRAARFHFRADALRCLAAEALLRHALYEAHGLDLASARIYTGRDGKPRLRGQLNVHFNLSHSGSWVMCALHDRPVGIDVEEERPRTTLPAESIMCDEEYGYFRSLAPPAASEFFYRLWTLKESLLKALGTGLRLAPRELLIQFKDAGVTASFAGRPLARWAIGELSMPEGAKASLCYRVLQ